MIDRIKMDASSVESPLAGGQKRKRTTPGVEEGRQPHSGGNVTQINYLVRSRADRLRLMEGDSETFGDILEMIDDYEGMSGLVSSEENTLFPEQHVSGYPSATIWNMVMCDRLCYSYI